MMNQTISVDFNNLRLAFAGRSNYSLTRAYWLFRIMNQPLLSGLLTSALMLAVKLRLPVGWLVRKTIFSHFCGGIDLNETLKVAASMREAGVGAILDFAVEGGSQESDFEQTVSGTLHTINNAAEGVREISLKMTGIGSSVLFEKVSRGVRLDQQEEEAWQRITGRLDKICSAAVQNNLILYIDAEESWIQPAIDLLAETMMKKYNIHRVHIVTTLQMYRKDRLMYLQRILADAARGGFLSGVKLVRGAYWEKEQDYALCNDSEVPVFLTKQETDNAFNLAVEICLMNLKHAFVCIGTHNEESVRKVTERMSGMGLPQDHPHVTFSQLYGMSDHISYNLAAHGYHTTKYLPFGPVEVVVPYLVRRAEENTAISGQVNRELSMIRAERLRRKNERIPLK